MGNCIVTNTEHSLDKRKSVVLFVEIAVEIIDDVIERVEKVQGPVKNVKVRSYIAQYPVHRTAQSALHFTPWQTCSFQGHLNFSGKHSAMLQLLREDYSFTFPPLYVLPGTHLYS